MDFQEMITELTMPGEEGAEPKYKMEDVQGIVDEYKAKDTEIEKLKKDLEEKTNQFETLKNRVIDNMFDNKKKPDPEDDDLKKKKEEPKPKTFKDLINPNYAVRQ